MRNYYAVVTEDRYYAFLIRFPDVPGCFSSADSMSSIIPNAVDALTLHLEDADPPAAQNLAAIRAEAASDLKEGAFLVMVPYIRNSGKLAKVSLSMDRVMLEAIDEAAVQRNLTRSAFLALAARNEIERRR
jgi:predicted RNase H-like HicB family nuclease